MATSAAVTIRLVRRKKQEWRLQTHNHNQRADLLCTVVKFERTRPGKLRMSFFLEMEKHAKISCIIVSANSYFISMSYESTTDSPASLLFLLNLRSCICATVSIGEHLKPIDLVCSEIRYLLPSVSSPHNSSLRIPRRGISTNNHRLGPYVTHDPDSSCHLEKR